MVQAWLILPEEKAVRPVEFSRESVVVSEDDKQMYRNIARFEGVAVEDCVAARTFIFERGAGESAREREAQGKWWRMSTPCTRVLWIVRPL